MSRWVMLALAVSVITAGCDDNGATSPSSLPLVFSAMLLPANEVPPVSNAESGGVGATQLTIHPTRDAGGAITGGTVDMYFQVSGFPSNLRVVGAHIHPGVAGVNGPALVSTGLTGAAPLVLETGTGEFRISGIPIDAATIQAIANNPAGWYFNVHSPLNPGGFARGQLTRLQ